MVLGDAFRTLVAVALSARTRDEQVLRLLPDLFEAFPTADELAAASVPHIESKIDTIGMYRQKARNLKKMAQVLVDQHGGCVPQTIDELTSLAGVGRKTASVVLLACFGEPAIAVDTHVHRVTNRLGWVKTKTPEQTEMALRQVVPRSMWRIVNQVFVKFGRYVCIPGRPRCWMCPIQADCPYKNKMLEVPTDALLIRQDIMRREDKLEADRQAVAAYGKS
jgi:endonuclease-3